MELTNDYGGNAQRTPVMKRCENCHKLRPIEAIAGGTCKGGCK